MEWIAHPSSIVRPSRLVSAPESALIRLDQELRAETVDKLNVYYRLLENDALAFADPDGLEPLHADLAAPQMQAGGLSEPVVDVGVADRAPAVGAG